MVKWEHEIGRDKVRCIFSKVNMSQGCNVLREHINTTIKNHRKQEGSV
jgi:hypothetical protein